MISNNKVLILENQGMELDKNHSVFFMHPSFCISKEEYLKLVRIGRENDRKRLLHRENDYPMIAEANLQNTLSKDKGV